MPELEIHHESEHAIDPMGQKVGILAAVLAVALAMATIASHRSHTEAIMQKSAANDAWAHYQSTRVKYHNLELGESLIGVLAAKGEAADKALASYAAQKKDYEERSQRFKAGRPKSRTSARRRPSIARCATTSAKDCSRIALVLSSLYFISRKRMFPAIGVAAGVAGAIIAITGLLV